MANIERREGRRAFGTDPAQYDRFRPDYPPQVYEILCSQCGLKPHTSAFEIGPGTGQATKHLLRLGAKPLVVEPDERLSAFLTAALVDASNCLTVQAIDFESGLLPSVSFDLGVAATAFHWLEQDRAIRKIARLLRPGGWWAMWWNIFGDPLGDDAFHDATHHLLEDLDRSPSAGCPGKLLFALDAEARRAELLGTGGFESIRYDLIRWTAIFDITQILGLYQSFPAISRLPAAEQARIFSELERITDREFKGRVVRPMLTPIYTARRRPVERNNI